MLLLQEIGGDRFNLLRRTSVQGGFRDGVGDLRRNLQDIFLRDLLQDSLLHRLQGSFDAVFEDRIILCLNHIIEELLDLRRLDSIEVIPDRHVEDNRVRTSQLQFLRQNVDQDPCLHIFFVGLPDFQLCRPLAVVAFVRRDDTGLRHTGGQLSAVHLLDGLELEPGRACQIGGNQVLCQLRVRTGGRAEYGFDLSVKNRIMLLASLQDLRNAEDAPAFLIFLHRPVKQLSVGNQSHQVTHVSILLPHFTPDLYCSTGMLLSYR